MSSIYSSLPNPRGDLPEIRNEFNELFNFFNSDKIKAKVDFGYSDKNTVDQLTSAIGKQKELRLFHFSGHSGASGLQFTEAEFDEEHFTKFFNTICAEDSKIECVFLNGCENEKIVNKLSNVPVVIGTKTKIEDKVASKFTKDFISVLIEGEKTYRQAYKIAAAAKDMEPQIVDRTDAMRGIKISDKTEPLNDYFMVINKAGVADRKFPFKRGKTNWTKILVVFFVIIALFIGYLFKDSIFKRVEGYNCDLIKTEKDKCNFVIGDFATIPKMEDFNAWLYGNVRNADVIRDYLHAINIERFDKVIHNNSIDRDSLPSLCNYDFNLTGSVTSEGSGLRAEFNVFPYVTGAQSPGSFVYAVPSLGYLDTMITVLNEKNAQQFVLYEMCISCALKRNMPDLPKVLQELAETFDASHSSAMYQRLQYSLAEVNLHYSDTTAALLSLERINNAAGNDIALMAMERKINLYLSSKNLLRAYQAQSDLVSAMQARVQYPGKYELNADPKQYADAENKVRMSRADLVLKHQDGALREFRSVATRDLEYLQKIRYQNRDYSREIIQLKSEKIEDTKVTDTKTRPIEQFHLSGRVTTEKGESLAGAILTFGDTKKRTDEKGQFDFGTFARTQVLGKQLHISRDGFQDKTIEINENSLGRIILTNTVPQSAPEKYQVYLQGVQINSALFRKVLGSLKSAGQPINTQLSENFSARPENFTKVSTVIFHQEGNRERAIALARQMQEWTKQSFELLLLPISSGKETRNRPREDITIQWLNGN